MVTAEPDRSPGLSATAVGFALVRRLNLRTVLLDGRLVQEANAKCLKGASEQHGAAM
jgi:hypothetical protein